MNILFWLAQWVRVERRGWLPFCVIVVDQGHAVTLMPTFSGKGDCLYQISKEVEFVYLADLVGCGAFPYLSKMIRLRALRKFIIGNARMS